jgi:hypothetical protein
LLFLAIAAVAQQGSNDQLRAELKKLGWRFGPTNGDITAVSSWALALLVVGPIISALWGEQYSIILLLPALYALGVGASVLNWSDRRRFGRSSGTALRISAELILCPICLTNVFKRISFAQSWDPNALAVAGFCALPKEAMATI